MDFSKFFIDRPIFAAVLSIVIFVAGLIAIPLLPISEYPEVVPPTVVVTATYPGANPKVIAETVSVAAGGADQRPPEHMMYMKSVAGSDGVLQMTITFEPGTDPNQAQVDVQKPRGPGAVAPAFGSGRARRDNPEAVADLRRPGHAILSGWPLRCALPAQLRQHQDQRRNSRALPGVGQIRMFGGGRLRDACLARSETGSLSRGLTAGDVVRAMRDQNIQVSAGQLGAEPIKGRQRFS